MEKKQVNEKGGYYSKLNQTFKATNFDKRYWKTFGIDLIYTVLIGLVLVGIIYSGFSYIKSNPEVFSNLELLQSMQSVEGVEDPSQIWTLLLPFITLIMGFVALFVLAQFLIGSVFKSWVWRVVLKKKMNFSFLLRYAGFRLLTAAVVVILLILAVFTGALAIILILGIILLIHLFAVSLIYLARDNIFWESIKKGAKKGIKIHLFLLPYLFFFALIIVRSLINNALQHLLVKTPTVFTDLQELVINLIPTVKAMFPYIIISMIIGLFFTAYIKIWYAEFVQRI